MISDYNLKSFLILILLIFLISLCLKCAIIEKFNSHIDETRQSINDVKVDLVGQLQNSSRSPSGYDGMGAYRRPSNYNPEENNTNITDPV